jgi:Peroxiredoxin
MQKKILQLLFFTCGLGMMVACRQDPSFNVKGVVAGANEQTIYLENVGLSAVELMDSVKLNSSGQFHFKKPRPDFPDFYRLRLNNQLINFAIDSTETISIIADAETFATSYSVEGSVGSSSIKEITLALLDAVQETKQSRKDYDMGVFPDSIYQQLYLTAIEKYKTVALKYIYEQPMSTAAYFALFQKIDGLFFFDLYDRNDSRAYGAVATSLNTLYPESPRTKHLYNLALQSLSVLRNERMVDMNAQVIDFPEIELPDVTGELIKLSGISKEKVVFLSFTAYQTEFSPELNQRLEDIYMKYNSKGLEIYQVSLDSDLHIWRNIASNLPWTCVHDQQSEDSQFAALYNVRQLPALFLLNKNGTIVKRIDNINTIENDVLALL